MSVSMSDLLIKIVVITPIKSFPIESNSKWSNLQAAAIIYLAIHSLHSYLVICQLLISSYQAEAGSQCYTQSGWSH